MTNDQKLVYLIHATDEMIKAQEKYENSPCQLFKDAWKKKQRDLKVWIAGNKIVSAAAPEVRKKQSFKKTTSYNNWLGR